MAPDMTPSRGFSGTISLQLPDLIQMVCFCRSDMIISVQSAQGSGTIHIKGGVVSHAQVGDVEGEAAFFEMLQWKDGRFETPPYADEPTVSIRKPWELLLLEATRQSDECAAGGMPDGLWSENELEGFSPHEIEINDSEMDGSDAFGGLGGLDLTGLDDPAIQGHSDELPQPEPARTLRVLVVDDSSFFARQLKHIIEADPLMEVVATAANGKEALDFLGSGQPVDLITLDIEMPVMKGDTALKNIMIRHPIPALIVSTLGAHSMEKVYEFLQLGAVDFMSKPQAREDLAAYGERLRALATSVAGADITHFRRLRRQKPVSAQAAAGPGTFAGRVLVILGAEGAYMDWLRLPFQQLCGNGLVIGLQKVPEPLLAGFCGLIQRSLEVRVRPVSATALLTPGSLHMTGAYQPVRLGLDPGTFSLAVESDHSETCGWGDGVAFWLDQLSEQAHGRMTVCLLSAAQPLPSALVSRLVGNDVRIILTPRDRALCTGLIDGLAPYSNDLPSQVRWAGPENLEEAWLNDTWHE